MKTTPDGKFICCELPHCTVVCPNHKWGKIFAHNAGWYFSKQGEAYCPIHNPAWVAEWRQWKAGYELEDPPCNRNWQPRAE